MLIVGMISTRQEAMEIQFIAKLFVVGNRARALSNQIKNKENIKKLEKRVNKRKQIRK